MVEPTDGAVADRGSATRATAIADWVLAAQRARRVTIAAKKAAAKAMTPAVQRQPSPPSPPPLPTPAPAPVPYREEEVATRHYPPGFPAPNYCGFIHYEAERRRRLLQFSLLRASSQPLPSRERELALPSKLAVWVLVTTRTTGAYCSV